MTQRAAERLGVGPAAFKTYVVGRPTATHFRPATCAEVDCERRARGWRTAVDLSTELGRKQARYIKNHSGRTFTHTQAGTIVALTFPPGQDCFEQHRVPLEREPLFVVRQGDRRGNPRGIAPIKLTPVAWRDDFGEHQEALADAHRRG